MSHKIVESLALDNKDAANQDFSSLMAEKVTDALNVHRVAVASEIINEKKGDTPPMAHRSAYVKAYAAAHKKGMKPKAAKKAAYSHIEDHFGSAAMNSLMQYHENNSNMDEEHKPLLPKQEVVQKNIDAGTLRPPRNVPSPSGRSKAGMENKLRNLAMKKLREMYGNDDDTVRPEDDENNEENPRSSSLDLEKYPPREVEQSEHGVGIHDMTHHEHDGDVYDQTQMDDNIKHGDVMKLSGGRTAVMFHAWPTMVVGDSDQLHKFRDDYDPPADMEKSIELARKLGGQSIGQSMTDDNSQQVQEEGGVPKTERHRKLAAKYGDPNTITRGDIIAAAQENLDEKRGLWANIHAKRKRIKDGSGEKMREPGSEGAPTEKALRDSQNEERVKPRKGGRVGTKPKEELPEPNYSNFNWKTREFNEEACSMSPREKLKAAMKKKLTEKTNPYAVGMAAAMEKTGDEPPLKKSTITLAHEIAAGVEKKKVTEETDDQNKKAMYLALLRKTRDPQYAEAARQAGASNAELKNALNEDKAEDKARAEQEYLEAQAQAKAQVDDAMKTISRLPVPASRKSGMRQGISRYLLGKSMSPQYYKGALDYEGFLANAGATAAGRARLLAALRRRQ